MTTATTNASTRPYHQNAARRNAKASATGKDARSTNKLDKAIGLKIRIARLQKLDDGGRPMSQITLGKALGVTFQQVQKYEKDVNRVGTGRMTVIARVLNQPMSFFTGETDGVQNERTIQINEFMATREGCQLIDAAMKLDDTMRQNLVNIARSLAKNN